MFFVFLFLKKREVRSTAHHLVFVLHAGILAQVQPHEDQHVPLNDLGTSRTRQGPNVSSTDWPWGKLIRFVTYFG